MIVTPKILPGGSAKLRWAGRGAGEPRYFIASVVQWKEKTLDVGGPSSIYFTYIFGGLIRSSEAAMGGGGAALRLAWKSPERRVRAAHGRARAAKTH
jgi:hypothetical protein